MTFITPETDPASDDAGVSSTFGTFTDYPLSPILLDALAERGLRMPTPIQAAAIPALLNGRDVVGQARTGSGKTLAFALPLLEAVDAGRASVQALVLAPTRELASQVAAVIADLGATKGITVALLYGGTSSGPQRTALRRGAQVAVGTPGRILDLIGQGALWLDQARFVVLDEADEMFDQGFAQDVERIMDKTSNSRQTALFSATMPEWVQQTAARYLYDPETIAVDAGSEPASLVPHIAYVVPSLDRPAGRGGYGRGRDDADMQAKVVALRDLLDHRGEGSTIVFGRTKQGVDALSRQLDRAGYPVGALQGNMTQAERDSVMAAFRSGRIDILVATNVAARGLDLVGVNLVVNVELPESAELLTHRVGRTGRMGRGGQAITLLAGADLARWQLLIRDVTLPILQLPWPGAVAALALDEHRPATPNAARDQIPARADLDEPAPASDDSLASAYPVEEAASMDESASPPPSARSRQPSDADPTANQPETGRYERPTRRASRRPETVTTPAGRAAPVSPERSRPAGDAADLIARALANVGVVGGAAPLPPAAAIAPTAEAAPPVPSPASRPVATPDRPMPLAQAERDDRRPVRPVAPVTAVPSAPVATVAPRAAPLEPLRGTPRPSWLRSAAERVGKWQLGVPATAIVSTPQHGLARSAAGFEAPVPRTVDASPSVPAAQRVDVEFRRPAAPAVLAADSNDPEPRSAEPDTRAHTPAPRPAATANPPQVRGRGASGATATPVALPVAPPVPPVTGPPVTGPPVTVSAIKQPAPPVAEPPVIRTAEPARVPTVRASRSRPAAPPVVQPVPVLDEATAEPISVPALDPVPDPAGAMPADDAAIAASTPENTLDTPAPVEAEPIQQPEAATEGTPPDVPAPPARRRTRSSRAAQSETDATDVPEGPSVAETAAVEPVAEVPAPKPRRASSRKSAAKVKVEEPTDAPEPPSAPTGDPVASAAEPTSSGSTSGEDTANLAADESPARTTRDNRRSGSRRGRTAAQQGTPDAASDLAPVDESDEVDAPDPNGPPAPATAPPRGRGGSRRSEPAEAPATEPAAGNRHRSERASEQSTAAGRGRATSTDEPAQPGNRRSPAERSAGTASGTSGGSRSSGSSAGAGQRNRSTGGDDQSGNTGGPANGNSLMARTTRPPSGAPSFGGSGPRRRPMAAPAATRCAACGTPNPRGSSRKYCPACERELAVRSQDS